MLLAISKYDAKETRSWLEKNDWTFPILCDGLDVIKTYRLLNEAQKNPDLKGIPHPATIIIDRNGIVRFKHVWVNYRQRTPMKTILEELDRLQ